MSKQGARAWFAATAACVLAGVVISAITAANNVHGHFQPAAARAANAFVFFTVQSNLLVGAATLLLAFNLHRSSTPFAVLRLTGLVAITVTGIVFHVALAQTLDLKNWDAIGNELVHTVVPVMAVVGWLMNGPRLLFSRGAITHWYPYPFIDVTQLGYGRAAVNCVWVAVLFLGLAAGATMIDRRLGRPGGQ